MPDPQIVTREQWLEARLELLAQEKKLFRHRDEVNAARRRLPMVEVTKDYTFDGPQGRASMVDVFEGRSQLVIYHAMFDPDDEQACPSCTFWLDNVGHLSHLHARDTTFAAVSQAPMDKLERYKRRMAWNFPWYSTYRSEFNVDFHYSYDPSIVPVEWNYKAYDQLVRENPAWEGYTGSESGVSAFLRHGDRVFHTYSCFARGIDLLNNTYNYLDLTARGRQEDWERPPGRSDGPPMSWLRRHDEYETAATGGADTPA